MYGKVEIQKKEKCVGKLKKKKKRQGNRKHCSVYANCSGMLPEGGQMLVLNTMYKSIYSPSLPLERDF